MKLITWNIQWGRGIDGRVDLGRIVRHARSMADFDVICMQEVADNFPGLAGNDDRDQFAELAALLPGYTAAAGHGVDVPGEDGRRRRFGNVIFSRYPVLSARRHALPWPADPGVETMARVFVDTTLQTPMGALRVGTTHLEYYSDVQRHAQARRLRRLHDEACERAARPGAPTADGGPFDAIPQAASAILAGDFNFPPGNAAYGELQQALAGGGPAFRDAWLSIHDRTPHTPTFCVHGKGYSKTPYCCDFVFVSADIARRVRGITVDADTLYSDHQPVLLDFDDRQDP